jgi:cell division protein FtsL
MINKRTTSRTQQLRQRLSQVFFKRQPTPLQLGLTLTVVLVMAAFYVFQQLKIESAARDIQALTRDRDRLENLNEFTMADIDEMSRFASIEKTARVKLGMEFPSEAPSTLIIIPPDEDEGMLASTMDKVLPELQGASR